MPENYPENHEKRSVAKPIGLLAGALALAAYFGAEPLVKRFVDAPEKPERPERVPVTAKRGPIQIAVGVDVTPSSIKEELPRVTKAIQDFIQQGGILQAGDKVTVCRFAEQADCQTFNLPQDQENLLDHIASVQTETRKGIQTHVKSSVLNIVQVTEEDENVIIVAWTDAIDEGPDVPEGTVIRMPVRIVVPRENFLRDARKVAERLPGDDIEAGLARNSEEFGGLLRDFTGDLQRRAQEEAQRKADAESDRTHQTALADYEGRMAKYHETLEALQERIMKIKRGIHIAIGVLVTFVLGLIGFDIRERTRPRLRGFLIDKRQPKYPTKYRLPSQTKPYNARRFINMDIIFTPARQGITVNGRVLQDGDEVSEGVYYQESERNH